MTASEGSLMLTYDLNARGTTPLYDFLYRSIRDDITSGTIAPGEKLPSKRTLAQHLNVGVATIAAAYEQLLTEGFIRTEQRRGYFAQDVSNFRRKTARNQGLLQAQATSGQADANDCGKPQPHADGDFFVDLKANRTSVSLFPATVWSKYMREALSLPTDSLLRTVPYNGLPELRRAIAAYLHRTRGMDVSPDWIVVGAGSEYLYGRLLQMFGPTIIFATETPGYRKFADISSSFGYPHRAVPIDDAGLNVDALERSGADVVHVSPANHFPTGIVMPITRRLELLEWANRAYKRFIIEDDYDSEFRYNGHLIMPLFADDVSGKVIYLNTFSKTMVPSLRISYMVLPPRLLRYYMDTMSFYSCTVSSFEQYALARFIDDGHFERHINRTRNFYRNQREAVLAAIAASHLRAIARVEERNAGTHFLLHVRTQLTEQEVRDRGAELGLNVSMYSDYAYDDEPARNSFAPQGGQKATSEAHASGEMTLVINYAGIESTRIKEAMERLAHVFNE